MLFATIFVAQNLIAQDKLPAPANTGDLLIQYDSLYNIEEYDKAYEALKKIPEGDTNYIDAQLKMTVCLGNLERYDEAIALSNRMIKAKHNQYRPQFWLNIGYNLDSKEEYQKALESYFELKKEYPYYYSVTNNIAYEYLQAKNYQASYDTYKELATIYPFSTNAHFNLGVFAFHEGHLTEAFLAFNTVILLDPGSERAFSVLGLLNELSNNTKMETTPKEGFNLESDEFSDIDVLIENYLALNDKYKVNTKSNIYLAKQNHLILSQILEKPLTDYFYNSYYTPFYRKLMQDGYYDEMQLFELLPSKGDAHKSLVEKNLPKLREFNTWIRSNWYKMHNKNEVNFMHLSGEKQFWYFNNGHIEAIGEADEEGLFKNDVIYFYDNGVVSSYGKYQKGLKEGKWIYFDEAGDKSGEVIYKEDKVTDTVLLFYNNGKLKNKITYLNGEKTGPFIDFYLNGNKYRTGSYQNGEYSGPMTYFFKHGSVEYNLNYKKGLLEGKLEEFYADGSLYREESFNADYANGAYKLFWPSGDKRRVGNKVAGDLTGEYILLSNRRNV